MLQTIPAAITMPIVIDAVGLLASVHEIITLLCPLVAASGRA